jgi:hypothetical protein
LVSSIGVAVFGYMVFDTVPWMNKGFGSGGVTFGNVIAFGDVLLPDFIGRISGTAKLALLGISDVTIVVAEVLREPSSTIALRVWAATFEAKTPNAIIATVLNMMVFILFPILSIFSTGLYSESANGPYRHRFHK